MQWKALQWLRERAPPAVVDAEADLDEMERRIVERNEIQARISECDRKALAEKVAEKDVGQRKDQPDPAVIEAEIARINSFIGTACVEELTVENGYGADRGNLIVAVKWHGPPGSELLLARDRGAMKRTQKEVAAALENGSASLLFSRQNNRPIDYTDTDVEAPGAYNYYAWIETPCAIPESEFPPELHRHRGAQPNTVFCSFLSERESVRVKSSQEAHLKRQVRVAELNGRISDIAPQPESIDEQVEEILRSMRKEQRTLDEIERALGNFGISDPLTLERVREELLARLSPQ